MELEEYEALGYWEQQVAASKEWDSLTTPIRKIDDEKSRMPLEARVRRANWPGYWFYMDGESFRLLEDADINGWKLKEAG